MSNLNFKIAPQKTGVEVTLIAEGSVVDFTMFVGMLIQGLHQRLPELLQPIFRYALQEMVKDDSFVYDPVKKTAGMYIDVDALKRQIREEQNE